MANTNYREKRNFARSQIETPVVYIMDNNDQMPCQGTSQNISASGIYITTDHAPKLDTEITIVLTPHNNQPSPKTIDGRVVRCRFDKKDPELFHVSIEFKHTHEAFVQTILSDQPS